LRRVSFTEGDAIAVKKIVQVTARLVLHLLSAAFLISFNTAASLSTRFPRRAVEPPLCSTAFSNTP
jgi:hypothetical protein